MMKDRRRIKERTVWLLMAGSLVLMIYNTFVYQKQAHPSPSQPEIRDGARFGGLRFTRSNGEELTIPSDGKYLVSFLTVECGPCQRQVESLNRVVTGGDYRGVFGVFYDSARRVAVFESAFKPQFTSLIKSAISNDPALDLSTFPQSVEINDGLVTKRWVGVQEKFD